MLKSLQDSATEWTLSRPKMDELDIPIEEKIMPQNVEADPYMTDFPVEPRTPVLTNIPGRVAGEDEVVTYVPPEEMKTYGGTEGRRTMVTPWGDFAEAGIPKKPDDVTMQVGEDWLKFWANFEKKRYSKYEENPLNWDIKAREEQFTKDQLKAYPDEPKYTSVIKANIDKYVGDLKERRKTAEVERDHIRTMFFDEHKQNLISMRQAATQKEIAKRHTTTIESAIDRQTKSQEATAQRQEDLRSQEGVKEVEKLIYDTTGGYTKTPPQAAYDSIKAMAYNHGLDVELIPGGEEDKKWIPRIQRIPFGFQPDGTHFSKYGWRHQEGGKWYWGKPGNPQRAPLSYSGEDVIATPEGSAGDNKKERAISILKESGKAVTPANIDYIIGQM
jgi:hypothetical protein